MKPEPLDPSVRHFVAHICDDGRFWGWFDGAWHDLSASEDDKGIFFRPGSKEEGSAKSPSSLSP